MGGRSPLLLRWAPRLGEQVGESTEQRGERGGCDSFVTLVCLDEVEGVNQGNKHGEADEGGGHLLVHQLMQQVLETCRLKITGWLVRTGEPS